VPGKPKTPKQLITKMAMAAATEVIKTAIQTMREVNANLQDTNKLLKKIVILLDEQNDILDEQIEKMDELKPKRVQKAQAKKAQ
jgi:hypothetical protein